MRKIIALLLLLLFAVPASAEYVLGTGGYYYQNGVAYSRTRYYQPGYSTHCGYQNAYYYYLYTPVDYTPPATVPYSPDWKTQLLKVKEKQIDYQAYLQALRESGLTVPYASAAYGAYGTLTVNGTTTYGHYQNQGLYQTPPAQLSAQDLLLLYQMSGQQGVALGRLYGEANAGFNGLLAAEQKRAEIYTKGQVAAALLQAVLSQNVQESRSATFTIGPAGVRADTSKVSPEDKARLLEIWKEHAAAKCLGCHNAQVKKGGFSVGEYPDMTPEQKQVVIRALTNPDATKRMPKNADGTPGTPLTPDELKLWLLN